MDERPLPSRMFHHPLVRIIVASSLALLLIVGGGAWIYVTHNRTWQRERLARKLRILDDRDWREAKRIDTSESYIKYLTAHRNGAFVEDAREEVRRFLTVKYFKLPKLGQVLITDGWSENISPLAGLQNYTQYIDEDGNTSLVFGSGVTLWPKDGNTFLVSRVPCASIYIYRDKNKGVLISGFEITLYGSPPIFHITTEQRWELFKALRNAPRERGSSSGHLIPNMPVYVSCNLNQFAGTYGQPEIDMNDVAGLKAVLKDVPTLLSREDNRNLLLRGAVLDDSKEMAEFLLANNADVNARDEDGRTALHRAVEFKHGDIAELLIASHADVNAKDADGATPLHLAAVSGQKEVAALLLAQHPDVNAKTKKGSTPLSLAVGAGHSDVADLLRQQGAKE